MRRGGVWGGVERRGRGRSRIFSEEGLCRNIVQRRLHSHGREGRIDEVSPVGFITCLYFPVLRGRLSLSRYRRIS